MGFPDPLTNALRRDSVRRTGYAQRGGEIACCIDLDGPGSVTIALFPRRSSGWAVSFPLSFRDVSRGVLG